MAQQMGFTKSKTQLSYYQSKKKVVEQTTSKSGTIIYDIIL